ncbi:MAG TPA: phage holin family protein [Candidatus Limnocylindrales bacterium]|nr:phage holin family protein [Candidatus Limnocylindrales bacterium]
MAALAIRTLLNGIALIAAVRLVPGVQFDGELWQLAAVAFIFGLINAYLRPLARLLSLPLNLLFFGLIGFVINTGLLLLLALISGELDLGFTLAGWPSGPLNVDVVLTAFLAALVVSVVSTVMAVVRLVTPRL